MIKRFTTKERTFEMSSDKRFIKVYINGRFDGFIFNNDRVIYIDGEEVIGSKLFK